jgi:hypothetical protein
VGYVDLRLVYFIPDRDRTGTPTADILFSEELLRMPVRVVDVVRVNALAVPLDAPASYAVLQHELRLVLSYLPDQVDEPLCLRTAEFRASASHIQRFVTESFGLGMLTAAVESQFGWELSERSLEHFDVLPTALAGRYQATGVRPDLLFQFHAAATLGSWLGRHAVARPNRRRPALHLLPSSVVWMICSAGQCAIAFIPSR